MVNGFTESSATAFPNDFFIADRDALAEFLIYNVARVNFFQEISFNEILWVQQMRNLPEGQNFFG